MNKRVFIIGGEESGDVHGAALINELKAVMPGIQVEGMGGGRMRAAGLTGLDSKEVSVVGIAEVIEKLPRLWRAYNSLKRRLADGGFDAVVLIDFPDFNLHMARVAGRLGIPVIYYISPQVWAWRRGRIKTIARLVRKMLVVFPFEAALYEKAGVDVTYVGHPLVDMARTEITGADARRSLGIDEASTVISLLPGSRSGEISRILPIMLNAGKAVNKALGRDVVYLLPAAASIEDALLARFIGNSRIRPRIVRGAMYAALRASDAAIVTSGTATLETALIGTPMAIVYKMSPLSAVFGRLLVRGRFVGLPNIVLNRAVVPELLQEAATAANISRELVSLVSDVERRKAMLKGFDEVRAALGAGGAAHRAAVAVKEVMTQS
ncbi:MAG: lipid-A-disaccharide synthase [Deltaproteobacteria bacterium]|nr:lipid-A-disaccharide synthase [Deltaproteobacteria bacterium]